MSALIFDNLTAGYGGKPVITSLSASAQPGKFIAVLGRNGCGKSTLLKTLAGVIPAQSGFVKLGDKPTSRFTRRELARQIAYLSQTRDMIWPLTVRDIIALGRAPYRGPLGKISTAGEAKIDAVILQLGLRDFSSRSVLQLSGGEQARVLLARVLAVNAQVLLADEPFASLDPAAQIELTEVLKNEARSGKTVIAAMHDLAIAYHYADEVWLMGHGAFIAKGRPEDVMTDIYLREAFGIRTPEGGFTLPRIANV
ncbi:ABC transporter ATP-binding protein [Robiginitomaculum antarcticum]|uniref:ABC transporter ATP-binding protein n=1 Tax=Robiginitomaculum antarcticum TaxID=437507 RepID=UPI00035FB26B|nr:ABC transporter ATP-binding protein [Robiginitomaculum antarcticum]